MHPHHTHDSGFSLVELSIVLVILGLLTGGILGGQALIKASEMRAITTELSTWQTAVNTFKQKYFGLPGDIINAQAFWSPAASCPPAPGDAPLGAATCNGNGDGDVGSATTAQRHEAFLFWQHLALSGLITGEFSGTSGAGGSSDHIIGTNAPTSKFGNGGWSGFYFQGGSTNQYDRDYGNTFVIGGQRSPYATNGKLLTPSEAWNIDTKMDDGLPARGSTIAHWLVNECSAADDGSSTNNDLDAHYRLEDDSIQCSLYFTGRF
jgi:prepilin-type N-terminal cleavage/methylation domain-containing protein